MLMGKHGLQGCDYMNGTEFARINGSYSTAFVATYVILNQDIPNNKTNFRLYGYFHYGGGTSVGSDNSNFKIDGTTIKSGSYRYYPGNTLMGYKDITIVHNSDGSFPGKNVGINASSFHLNGSANGNIYASNIPRKANVTRANDFNDEQSPYMEFNNPGGFTINAKLEFGSTNILRNNIPNNGKYTFSLSQSEKDLLLQKATSNTLPVRYTIETVIGSDRFYSWVDKTMTVVNAEPTFSNYDFKDVNSKTTALTGNNKKFVLGYSNIKVTISTANKAVAKKKATMVKYRVTNDNNSIDVNYSNKEVSGTLNNVKSGTMSVFAVDSRNNSKEVKKLSSANINYTPLNKINIDVFRNNGISQETTLKLNGNINTINFGSKTNSIKYSQFRYRVSGSSSWSNYKPITLSVSNGNFSFNNKIIGDTGSGFNINNSYQIEVLVKDELSEVTFTDTLSSGIPNLALAKNGVGIMGKYDNSVGGKGQVAGNPLAYYPIGAVYISISNTNPHDLFGGTWEAISQGRFLIGVGSPQSNTVNTFGDLNNSGYSFKTQDKGGQYKHKLTVSEMPKHNHFVSDAGYDGGSSGDLLNFHSNQVKVASYMKTSETGGDGTHNNIPPYFAVYMWKRIG